MAATVEWVRSARTTSKRSCRSGQHD